MEHRCPQKTEEQMGINIDAYNLPRPSVLARKKLDDEIKELKASIEMLRKANQYGIEAWRLKHLEDDGK